MRVLPAILVLVGAASYGVLATIVKTAYSNGFYVNQVTGSQMLIGMIVLWLITLLRKPKFFPISVKSIVVLPIVGTTIGLTGILYYSSLLYIPASLAIILLFQFTWIGVLMEWMLDKKKPTKNTYISLFLLFIGTCLAANIWSMNLYELSWIGKFFGLGSAISYASFILFSGRASIHIDSWVRSSLMITGSCILVLIIFPPVYLYNGLFLEGLWKYSIFLALFGAIIPTVCYTQGAPKLKNGVATILSSIELPVAVFLAWIILSEDVVLLQWIGILIIILAIIIREKHFGNSKIYPEYESKRT